MPRPTTPRIPPVDPGAMTESQRAVVGIAISNVVLTLVRDEDLVTPWLTLAGRLGFGSRLSPRDRELVILRVALRTECEYEWGHATIALGLGVTAAEVQALSDASGAWSNADATLLGAVDEVCAEDCVSDETWAGLAATRDDAQLVELLALIGFYRMNAGMLNSMGVQREPGAPRLGEVPAPGVTRPPQSSPPPSATDRASGAATTQPRGSGVGGTWQIVFHHPTGDQQLTLVMDTINGSMSGSVTNPALKVSLPIVEGSVDGNHFSFRAPLKMPLEVDITYDGSVDGDAIAGHIAIQGGGSFPFEGTRLS
jgi:4-carboxymuconolactone decarboxylase